MKEPTYTILRRPKWDRRFFSEKTWYTIGRFIFRPEELPAIWRMILAHEKLHSRRQRKMWTPIWMYRYFTDRIFRLAEEAKGIAVELFESHLPEDNDWFQRHLSYYVEKLMSETYMNAALSIDEARDAIMREYHELLRNNGVPEV